MYRVQNSKFKKIRGHNKTQVYIVKHIAGSSPRIQTKNIKLE